MRALIAGLAAAAALALAPGAGAQGLDTTCLLALTKTDPATVNIAFPDEGAVYWSGGYAALPGTRLRIDGEFPHARYMSFNVYDPLQRPLDAIADAEIVPDEGSSNPFLAGADRNAEPRSYSVFVEFGPKPENPAPNTIYTGSGQNGAPNLVGTLIYRVYVPDAGRDEAGGARIPTVTLQSQGGGKAARSACADVAKPALPGGINDAVAASSLDLPPSGPTATPTPTWLKFVNLLVTLGGDTPTNRELGGKGGFFSNVHNSYVTASLSRDFGQVVVTRVKTPTFPDTRPGTATMPSAQLRYFSMCENHLVTQRFIDCLTDDQTVIGPDGYATYVLSTPAERPATATAECGVNWMPWGPFRAGLLIYRHMLPDPGFAEAIQNAERGREAETMGAYLPSSVYYADGEAYDAEVGC